MPVYSVTLSLDTAIYAAADLLADTQLVNALVKQPGKEPVLDTIEITDDDDQGAAMTIVLLNAATSMGAENSAPTITDANVNAAVVTQVGILTTDYLDLGGAKRATRSNLNLPLAITTGLWIAVINGAGTPTYTAAGLKVKLNIRHR